MVFTVFLSKISLTPAVAEPVFRLENEIAAEAMGIDTTRYKVLAFTIGTAFAGVAGAMFSHYFYVAHPASFTFMKSFDILTIVRYWVG